MKKGRKCSKELEEGVFPKKEDERNLEPCKDRTGKAWKTIQLYLREQTSGEDK